MDRKTLLVCAATPGELETFRADGDTWTVTERDYFAEDRAAVYLLTGVGIPWTLGRLLPAVERLRPARILNIGIAGAYPSSGLSVGDIVVGSSEVYGDVGFELPDAEGFAPLGASPMGQAFYTQPFPLTPEPRFLVQIPGLRVHVAAGCTVNACTGTEATGRRRAAQFGAAFESMEGAAVAQAGAQAGIPVCEVRAISNSAATRDMRPENIREALTRLRQYLAACRTGGRATT